MPQPSSVFIREIEAAINCCGNGPLLVHANIMYAMKAVPLSSDINSLLSSHISALESCAAFRPLWFPAFNYNFPKTKRYDLELSPSEVGQLSEFARTHWADWRTNVPIFSICGKGKKPNVDSQAVINPFSDHSVFAELVNRDGVVLLYGTGITSSTIIHHVEAMAENGVLYRYDKRFIGTLIDSDGQDKEIVLENHVRPWDQYLEYDWDKIERDLSAENILYRIKDGASYATVFSAKCFCDHLLKCMQEDPYYLLDTKSRLWVEPFVNNLGRRLQQSDFEY